MFIFFIPVFDCSHTCKPYKSHLALFIISNKSSARSFSASNDYFPHRTTISYRSAEALYLKLFEIQCFPAFSISSCWYYYFTIQHLFGVTVSIKKEASSLFTHYWLPILLILFTSLRLKRVFHFKHNLCFPTSLLHTTWFQHIPVARIIRKIADWLARLSLSNLQSRLLFPCL